MDFELTVVQGRSASSTIKLIDGVTTIGRHDACQLRIQSSQVSRKHCEIFEKKGLLLVKDLNSSNGTIVNGKRIEGQRVLEAGDELTIGPILLRVVKIGTAVTSAPAKPGAKASDTAVTAAIGAEQGEEDDFALSLDDDTNTTAEPVTVAAPAPKKPAAKAKTPQPSDDDDFADFLIDMPIEGEEEVPLDATEATQVVALAADPKASSPAEIIAANAKTPVKEEAPPEKPKAPEASDDAIADFLLDIKLEDE
jgi:pSer/pThr/pTyr-binding forkhead associated (FHA) protein